MQREQPLKGSFKVGEAKPKKIVLNGEVLFPIPKGDYLACLAQQLIQCLADTLAAASPEQADFVKAELLGTDDDISDHDVDDTDGSDMSDEDDMGDVHSEKVVATEEKTDAEA